MLAELTWQSTVLWSVIVVCITVFLTVGTIASTRRASTVEGNNADSE